VSEIDGRTLEEAPGPRTEEARAAFRRALEEGMEAQWTSN
jgi:hypothetical protein